MEDKMDKIIKCEDSNLNVKNVGTILSLFELYKNEGYDVVLDCFNDNCWVSNFNPTIINVGIKCRKRGSKKEHPLIVVINDRVKIECNTVEMETGNSDGISSALFYVRSHPFNDDLCEIEHPKGEYYIDPIDFKDIETIRVDGNTTYINLKQRIGV
jgi:hypothetical protein